MVTPAPATPGTVPNSVILTEAVVVALAVATLAVLFSPGDLGATVHPHPAWAAVILLSARYCGRGFAFAVASVWGILTLTAGLMGLGLGPLASISTSAPDLVALGVSMLVAWVASVHERRILELAAGVTHLRRQKAHAGAVVSALQKAALALRARADRLDHSVTFTRDVASRLESRDAIAASHAALELALARTGARAGVVQLVAGRRLRTVASMGTWTLQRSSPPDVFADATIQAAFDSGRPTMATELDDAGSDDSDVAFPIVDGKGPLQGILALRGVPPESLTAALTHDVALIASWCGKASAPAAIQEIADRVPKDPRAGQFVAWDAPTMPAMRLT